MAKEERVMDRNQELKRNTIVFGIGVFGAKLMQFILIPLYTIYLSTADYSTSDIISSTVTMLLPFFTLGMGHGILRFVLGKPEHRKPLLQFSIRICLISTAILFALLPLFKWFGIFMGNEVFIPLLFLFVSLKTVLANYCKAIDKNKIYALNGIISAVTTAFFSWFLLGILRIGVKGYLIAILISNIISVLYFCINCNVVSTLRLNVENKEVVRDTLRYSVPLMPNDLAWWIIQMSDRYMVTWICGAAVNGVYTMAYKIPGIFNILVSIFIQAFNITAFKVCDLNDQDGKVDGTYFENLYSKYLAMTFVAVTFVMLATQPIALLLIKKDFYLSWTFTPFLLIAFAIGNLESFIGSILGGIKKTNISFLSTVIGAAVNIMLNLLLIRKYQTYGAIIATVIGYFIVYIIRLIGVKKYVSMNMFSKKSICSLVLLLLMAICYVNNNIPIRIVSIIMMLMILLLYKDESLNMIKLLYVKLMSIINKI